ncbi:serine/threonine protein kinase [Gracilibacillus caseinilyticus]|uniref:non-specific serine/threonine protein kinase n=1 Tax=Gracilibacillus caseinilyticus TaxID=2932256 RepID=A0ABY4ETK9_9BACI|nr:serine/threonine-protein kinase [Gracilibacillus caseinilyticus]UOQ47753.1 serine/threonine protein kinase [Gracilibacillus caseinilyticus]
MLLVDTLLSLEFKEDIGDEGRNSDVHIAYDPQLNADLVVKIIDKSDFNNEDDFFKEAQMLYATQHPNIMEVKYASQDEKNIYLAMQYFKNGSLNSLMNERYLTVKEIIKYSLEFLSGIHFMHTKKLIHFDIKPTNILISNSNKAVVTDFGLSKYLNDSGFATPDKLYPLHIPPEAFVFGKQSFFTDVYQAGLTIYRMCNGDDFFKDQLNKLNINTNGELGEAIKKGKFPKRDSFLPHIPDKFQRIIKKALIPDVKSRYETVLDMINDISGVEEEANWVYTEDTNKSSQWTKENDTHIFKLNLFKESNNWVTFGEKIRKSDGNSRKVTKWCNNEYTSKEEAYKHLKQLMQ